MARPRNHPDEAPEKAKVPDNVGKRVSFDQATWQSLDLLARDRMMTFQELADEAFLDVLRKHNRPYDTRDALKRSAGWRRRTTIRTKSESRPQKANGPPRGGRVPDQLPH